MKKYNGLNEKELMALEMMFTGASYDKIAAKLEIDRITFYHWRKKASFQAAYNQMLSNMQQNIEGNITSLAQQAIDAISQILQNGNESGKLKVAQFILDKLGSIKPGTTDVHQIIKSQSSRILNDIELFDVDTDEYKKLCKENGVKPEI